MAEDAHRPLRGASARSLEQVFKRLEELQMRQEACEARLRDNVTRLDVDERHHAEIEQAVKDAIGLVLAMHDAERPVTADGVSGDWAPAPRPGRPKLRVIMGGLAVTVAGMFLPAAAHAVTHHHAKHIAAVRTCDQRGRRCADSDGDRMGT